MSESQLSSFLKSFGGQSETQENRKIDQRDTIADGEAERGLFGGEETADPVQMQIAQMENLIQMKTQQIERLQAEIRTLLRIQNDQAIALEMALQDRRELEKQLAQNQRSGVVVPTLNIGEEVRPIQTPTRTSSSRIQNKETPYFLENSLFLRAFLRNDMMALDELIKSIQTISDPNTRGLAGQALFMQMQKYMQLNTFFERLCDESGTDNFVNTFESNVRNLVDARRIVLWAHVPSAGVIVSRTMAMVIPENEGLLGKTLREDQRLVLTDPSRNPSYSMDYDAPLLANARVSVYQPVTDSKKEVIWIIQIVDRLNAKGSVVTPSGDDFLILDFLRTSLLKLYQEEARVDEMIKKILTESTRSLLTERQVMPLLETVQLTVTRLVGCEALEIFFADSSEDTLFQLKEVADTGSGNTEVSKLGQVNRVNVPIADAGIAGVAFRSKKSVNVAVAKEHEGYNPDIDGRYPNGALIAVPLLSSKGVVSLVAVARQKRNGIMFTDSDEIILEALSRVSQGALSNAQSHERNIAEIQKALTNHKYYTALLAVAQDLSSVLDTDTLVRKIMTKAQSFMAADRCSLFLVDKERGGLWSMVAHGATERIYVPEGEGIAGHVALTGKTLNIPDAYQDPRFNRSVDQSTGYRTKSILCVPINTSNGGVIGCTQMINKLGAAEFSSTDAELMTAFNVFCGIALSNARLFEAATESKKKMTAMLDIALSLSSATVDSLITNIMKRARELIEAEHCWLFIHEKEDHLCRPLALKEEKAREFSVKHDPVGYVALTGAEVNASNPETDMRYDLEFSRQMKIETKSLLTVPVLDASAQIIGVVKAVNKKGLQKFSEEDQSLLSAFASFAGLALDQWIAERPRKSDVQLVDQLSPSELTSVDLAERAKLFENQMSSIMSDRFDIYSCSKNDQFRIVLHIFDHFDLLQTYQISIGVLLRFLSSVYDEYRLIPFHSWDSAIGSVQFLFYLMTLSSATVTFSKMEIFVLFVTALCHDIGQKARNEAIRFTKKAQIPLGILYNNQPVMETFHCQAMIRVMAQPNSNILAGLDTEQKKAFWSLTTECILAMDMNQHQKIMEEVANKLDEWDGAFQTSSPEGKMLLMKMMMKSLRDAPAARFLDLKAPWTQSLVEKAIIQEDGTTRDSDKKIAEAQISYMSEYCVPLFTNLGLMVPAVAGIAEQTRVNLALWRNIASEKN